MGTRRRRALAKLAWLPLLVAAACTCRPTGADWLAAGAAPFASPEAAFATLRTAVGGDDPALEYRCLSAGFRRRAGLSQLAYREFRARELARQPWLRRFSCAELVELSRVDERRAVAIAEVRTLLASTRVRLELVREDFYDLFDGAEAVGGEALEDLRDAVRERASPSGTPGLALWVPLPPGRGLAEVTRISAGREWKIDAWALLDDGPAQEEP